MLTSLKLINEFVKIDDLEAEEIAKKLTSAGLEVEGIKRMAEATSLTIGHVLTCVPHPDSDHLHVLSIDLGKYGIKQIVCGAPNVKVGLNVIVAMVGATLPAISVTIKEGLIRQVKSEGMCCSLSELGVSKALQSTEQLEGIEILPSEAPLGTDDVLGYLGLDDVILDINVLANRPDCLSHLGVAHEIATILNRHFMEPKYLPLKEMKGDLSVTIKTPSCSVFDLLEITNISNNKPTPIKIRRYLEALGMRSISPLVDLGNFVMAVIGQPLHIYDVELLPSKELVVSDNSNGEVTCLDDKNYQIKEGDITISSGSQISCLGGVMGAKACAISSTTTHIALEAAYFYHAAIRRTAMRLGLQSESSNHFVRGVNPNYQEEALSLALTILKTYFPELQIKSYISINHLKDDEMVKPVRYSANLINHRLGSHYSIEEINETLSSLNIKLTKLDSDFYEAVSPSYRWDLLTVADLSEEIFRLHSFKDLAMEFPTLPLTLGGRNHKQTKIHQVREALINQGLQEVVSYSLVNEKQNDDYLVFEKKEPYKILNALTSDHEYMRRELLSSLVLTMDYNQNHQNSDGSFFEISECYQENSELTLLSFGLMGKIKEEGLLKVRPYSFFDLKGLFGLILDIFKVKNSRVRMEKGTNENFHAGVSASYYLGKELLGTIGLTNPLKHQDNNYLLGEINLTLLISLNEVATKMVPLNLFPRVTRDLALVVSQDVEAKTIETQIKKSGSGYVTEVELFDEFKGGTLLENQKSLAFKITLENAKQTFNETELSNIMKTIIDDLKAHLHAELRA